ncbi:MAG: hypothetical protein JSU59_08165 [Nitrospirota bacterium]|nr:MAG: hypothetical protein JSU59_08165 [Nitrospirota bacterium]
MATQPDSPQFEQSLEGKQFKLVDAERRNKVIELAFDYRGDVTLELRSGDRLEGYVYHRNSRGPSPSLHVFPKNQAGSKEVGYEDIVSIVFSGEDTAFGKSWEDWLNKKKQD